jgi:hypothetical protein
MFAVLRSQLYADTKQLMFVHNIAKKALQGVIKLAHE